MRDSFFWFPWDISHCQHTLLLTGGHLLSQNPLGGSTSVGNLAFCEASSKWSFSRLTMRLSVVASFVETRPGLARYRGRLWELALSY
jgi:hypothetical protein